MDISCVFVVSKYGDVILSKDYLFDGILGKFAPEFRQRLLNELDDDDVDEDDERRLPDQKVGETEVSQWRVSNLVGIFYFR